MIIEFEPTFPAMSSATAVIVFEPGTKKMFRASKVWPLMSAGIVMPAAGFTTVICLRFFAAKVPPKSTHKASIEVPFAGSLMETEGMPAALETTGSALHG
jgi:hypothetical protein